VAELKEGSRVLVDQLKLMDEKYYELREKLELNRKRSSSEIDKMKKQCADLRTKYVLATGKTNLDSVRLPTQLISDSREFGSDDWPDYNNMANGLMSSRSPALSSRPVTAPNTTRGQKLSQQQQPQAKVSNTQSVLQMRMSHIRAHNAEASAELPPEDRLNIVLGKIAMKDDNMNGKKWTREGLQGLIGK
jgi:hypothetical protein